MTVQRLNFDAPFDPQALTIAPSVHPAARETSALAAVANQPRKGTQNAVVLDLITAAGDIGLSDIEIQRATGYPRQTICARRGDLRALITVGGRYKWNGFGYTRWRRKTAEEMNA